MLEASQSFDQRSGALDREFLGCFGPEQDFGSNEYHACLYKASSSVLLTLVVPEENQTREEALELLALPEALWTVLVINGPMNRVDGFQQDPPEFLTPATQFLRGICGAIYSQRFRVGPILDQLRKRLSGEMVKSPGATRLT